MSIPHQIVQRYKPLIDMHTPEMAVVGSNEYPIPRFNTDNLILLCNETTKILQNEKTLLKIDGPVIIVGDLHGNISDLCRIIRFSGNPEFTKYLFLGDYVDRGDYSVEVVTLLFALKCCYPESIFLLRGNHEFAKTNGKYGFLDSIKDYNKPNELWETFNFTFSWLPLAAIVNESHFCVHGGISSRITSLKKLATVPRPIVDIFSDPFSCLISDLMWSDPNDHVMAYEPSQRGIGNYYGFVAVEGFLTEFKLKTIIRAHEFINTGVRYSIGHKVITVFSSSDYNEGKENIAGTILIDHSDIAKPVLLSHISHPKKNECKFDYIRVEAHNVIPKPKFIPKSMSNLNFIKCQIRLKPSGIIAANYSPPPGKQMVKGPQIPICRTPASLPRLIL